MNHPRPHQLIQVPMNQAVPPPLLPPAPVPVPVSAPAPVPVPVPRATSTRPRRRRFRAPRALREDAFWTGALTALCIGGLVMAIIATS